MKTDGQTDMRNLKPLFGILVTRLKYFTVFLFALSTHPFYFAFIPILNVSLDFKRILNCTKYSA